MGMSYETPLVNPSTEATEATLLNQPRKSQRGRVYCIFCGGDHFSSDCKEAIQYSLERKKQTCFKHGACFKCVGSNPLTRFGRSKVRCSSCGGCICLLCAVLHIALR
ncbi:hypothetical protein TNIN_461381 [Trichonephila inaurata madagascariensis]|uniref:Uncharacterized protein n=1 Tax=Trichonephila inaurata madagascariensis TaxID=2747483 RepID=A0A8X7C109_9ARAC|nr:hypothetical protein TNIN_461381 [Trichonephila inaurata madagascariensis]